MQPVIEVCVEGLRGAQIAIEAGADRLEVNSSLVLDGLTPTSEVCVAIKQLSNTPLIAMLRPHADGFHYDQAAKLRILQDLENLLAAGVDGIACGGLTATREIDVALMAKIRGLCVHRTLVMHRAFDQLRDQFTGLEQMIDVGVDRILTSGGQPTAIAGISQLKRLMDCSRNRIEILPAAGVRPSNALSILQATGCNQLHGTFKQDLPNEILPDPDAIAAVKRLMAQFASSCS